MDILKTSMYPAAFESSDCVPCTFHSGRARKTRRTALPSIPDAPSTRMFRLWLSVPLTSLEKPQIRQRHRPRPLEPVFLRSDEIRIIPGRHENIVGRILAELLR